MPEKTEEAALEVRPCHKSAFPLPPNNHPVVRQLE
jgi:hypothetical protein